MAGLFGMTPGTVTPLWQTSVNSIGQPIVYPQGGTPEVTAFLVEMAPGERTPWHQHPVPLLGYILEGELTVQLASGGQRVMKTGQISHEGVDVIHQGISTGAVPVKIIVFAIGLQNVPMTIIEENQSP
jgi:quercetin dioxygenase-like cupin family protein